MKNRKILVAVFWLSLCVFISRGLYVQAAGKEVITEQEKEEGTVYVVAQDGSGDFTTIQSGVDAAESGDTLLIYPGTYTEAVEIMGKTVHLLGVDRDLCIIQYNTSAYCKVPLTLAAGRVSNLTIFGMTEQNDTEAIREAEYEWQKPYSGYAVHVDQNYLYGRVLSFENCRIISQNSHCVGIGCRGESRISFTHCELIASGMGGCIFLHDPSTEEVGGVTNFEIRDSIMQSSLCPYIMSIHAMLPTNTMYLSFQNVHVYAVAYGDMGGYDKTNMNTGIDIDTVAEMEQQGLLGQAGFQTSLDTPIVHTLSHEEEKTFMERDGSVIPVLQEGITYIGAKLSQAENPGGHKRFVINVHNRDGIVGNGWCGLSNTYLTPDCFGNTLVEMNSIK